MRVEVKNIDGWKWENLDEVVTAELACKAFFDLPLGEGDKTTDCLGVIENFDVFGNIEFYYVGYVYPSQLNQVPALGDPINFDITIITNEE